MSARGSDTAGRCCYCRGTLHAGGASWRCPDCGVLIHPGCARELRGPDCPTLGCASVAAWAWAERPRSPVVRITPAVWAFAVAMLVVVGGGQAALLLQVTTTRVAPPPEPDPEPVAVEPCIFFPAAEEAEPPPAPPSPPPPPSPQPSPTQPLSRVFPEGTTFVTLTRRHVERVEEDGARSTLSRHTILRRLVLVESSPESACGNQWSYFLEETGPCVVGPRFHAPELSSWRVEYRGPPAPAPDDWLERVRVPAGEYACTVSKSFGCGPCSSVGTSEWWCSALPIPTRVERTESRRGSRLEEVTELVAIERPGEKVSLR